MEPVQGKRKSVIIILIVVAVCVVVVGALVATYNPESRQEAKCETRETVGRDGVKMVVEDCE